MSRLSTILIVIAMVVTAGSIAVVLNIQFAFPLGQSAALGLALLFALALFHVQIERRRDRRWLETRIAEISAVAADVNTEVGKVATRVVRLDQSLDTRIREENEPLAAEVEVLGQLMKQIAETLADVEIRFERRIDEVAARAEAPRLAAPEAPRAIAPPAAPEIASPPPARVDTARIPSAFEREVEAAIKAERIEIHLQPVVTLPQRKVRYYEVLTRLRGSDGRLIPAGEFIQAAEDRRMIARLDTYQVIRSFQILKRLTARNTEVGLFVNLSAYSLIDGTFFREFQSFLGQNRQVADLVQFEFTQGAVRDMGPLETETLRAIADLGFRFCIDNVDDLKMDFRSLADVGFRTAKVSADRLLGRAPVVTGDIHPADLSGHLQRQGMTLIVDRIETESQVIDLLDYEIRLAQGYLFSAPRQVRPEILGAAQPAQPAPKTARGAG
jgi:cyclic-di-GMP phosphodiesterase TipF (flagellum assembly factor)